MSNLEETQISSDELNTLLEIKEDDKLEET